MTCPLNVGLVDIPAIVPTVELFGAFHPRPRPVDVSDFVTVTVAPPSYATVTPKTLVPVSPLNEVLNPHESDFDDGTPLTNDIGEMFALEEYSYAPILLSVNVPFVGCDVMAIVP